jgi:iron-sulfur cluster repair protein YtfE (RIC family)
MTFGGFMTTKIEVTKDSVIGEVIKSVPGAEDIIKKYFGTGCFTCPGINVESITFGAAMHNVDPEKVVSEITELIEKGS